MLIVLAVALLSGCITLALKLLSPHMRLIKLLLAIALVAAVVVAARRMGASGRKPPSAQAQAFAAALFELHGQWTTNGNGAVFSRDRWPASLKALRVNGLEVNRSWARASRREEGPWGIWWSRGYQVQRQHTNDNTWTLYRVYSFGGPG